MKALVTILLSLCLLACSDAPLAPVGNFQFMAPRPFGYVNGDEIRHRIILETRNGVQLQRGALPKRGAIKRWLNLNRLAISEQKISGGFHYEIDLVYQAFYAPLEVKMLTIPGFNLTLAQGGNTATQAVPAWHFTLSPLRELSIRKDESGQYLRPDAVPPLLNNDGVLYGLAAAAVVTLYSAAYLAYLHGCLPGLPKRRIFKQAGKQLARCSERQSEEALSVLHQALNAVNGAPLFRHQLAGFYRRHPQYQCAGPQLEWFFQASTHFFLGGGDSPADTVARCRAASALCLDIEQGGR